MINGEPAMKVFTTGQVAKICKVAPRTVSKWFDSGRLKGYRIPGSQDRRIPREYLIKFLKEHGMPLGDLEDEAVAKVLIVAQDQILFENLKRELPPEKSFKVAVAASGSSICIYVCAGLFKPMSFSSHHNNTSCTTYVVLYSTAC